MVSGKMQAMALRDPGPDGRLELVRVPRPSPAPGEVLIEVAAAGLNRADLFQLSGNYPAPSGDLMIPGLEVSGRVVALGEGALGFAEGDAVCALLKQGGYAEYVCAPVGQVMPVPRGIALEDAASLPEALGTVWLALFELGRLRAGDHVVIHGGASGIGSAAIQLVRLAGAHPIATARSEEKRRYCEALGARVLEAVPEGFTARVKEATGGHGADVLLDMLGGAYAAEHLTAMAPRGRIVTIALQAGAEATLSLGKLLLGNLSWHGMTLGSRSVDEKAALLAAMRQRVWPWIEEGEYRETVDRRYPLNEATTALQAMKRSEHLGKILLTCQQTS